MTSVGLIALAIGGWLWTIYSFGATPWAAVVWAAFAFLAVVLTKRTALRIVAFNAALLIVLSGFFAPSFEQGGSCEDARVPLWVDDPAVTYRNAPNLEARDTRMCDGKIIYDSIYRTDAHGLRISPPESADGSDDCVLFFGCSFTFGTGVKNEETMPYRVGLAARNHYQVRNFGVGGYGPHHILATVEGSDWLEALRCKPKVAIYQAIPSHANRAVESWHVESDMPGPRYVLAPGGSLLREGNLRDVRERNLLTRLLSGWPPTRRFLEERDQGIDDETAAVFIALVEAWASSLRQRFPEISVHVIYWAHLSNRELPWQRLQDVTVHRIADILPQTDNWEATYHIPGDGHPNAAAHRLIAEYVVREILKVP
jgi:sirohydrochlorin ferrochelatase